MDPAEKNKIIMRGLERRVKEWGEAQTEQGEREADNDFQSLLNLTCGSNKEKREYSKIYNNRKKQYAED